LRGYIVGIVLNAYLSGIEEFLSASRMVKSARKAKSDANISNKKGKRKRHWDK